MTAQSTLKNMVGLVEYIVKMCQNLYCIFKLTDLRRKSFNGRKQTKFSIDFSGSNCFVSEKPVKIEKKHPGLEDIMKVRTIFITKHTVPSVLEREEVIQNDRW